MTTKHKGNTLLCIIGVLGAAVAIIPLPVYHLIEMVGRDDHMKMACHTANGVATVVGAVITAIVVLALLVRKAIYIVVSILLLCGGIAAFAVPRIFPLCGAADMACRYITRPTLTMLGATIIILSLVLLAGQVIAIRKRPAA